MLGEFISELKVKGTVNESPAGEAAHCAAGAAPPVIVGICSTITGIVVMEPGQEPVLAVSTADRLTESRAIHWTLIQFVNTVAFMGLVIVALVAGATVQAKVEFKFASGIV